MIFEHDRQRMVFELIAGIHIKTRRRINRILKGHNLTYSQFGALMVLASLRKNGGMMSQTDLARTLETDTTNAMVICNGLEKKGYVLRSQPELDRRKNMLSVTDAGVKKVEKVLPRIEEYFQPIAGLLTQNEIDALVPVLTKLYGKIVEKEERK